MMGVHLLPVIPILFSYQAARREDGFDVAGLESRAARAKFEEVVVEVSYFALDMAVDFMTSRSEGDDCDQTTFSPTIFPM